MFSCQLAHEQDKDKKAGYIKKIEKAKIDAEKDDLFQKISKVALNTQVTKDNLSSLSTTISNPFESVASLFKDVKLVNISTKDIVIKVPMIYGDDLVSYIQ
ncbi:MAG: hypothetical protein GXP45_04770 [bacterium]|nr:hypothetical protein [bacterium]